MYLKMTFAMALVTLATVTHAQDVSPSSASALLTVRGTRPVVLRLHQPYFPPAMFNVQSKFRMIFKVQSAQNRDLPIATIGYGGFRADFLDGWQAFGLRRNVRCQAFRQDLQGAETVTGPTVGLADSLRSLGQHPDVTTVASLGRPTYVSVDFACDGAIGVGDVVSVQIRFYVRQQSGWARADYSFEELQVADAN